jgi:hypothetical protein
MHGDTQTYKIVTAQQVRLVHILVNTKEDLTRSQWSLFVGLITKYMSTCLSTQNNMQNEWTYAAA